MKRLLALGLIAALGIPSVGIAAYPQTKPNAGQYCKKSDAGKVTRAKNGMKVKCKKVHGRYRWQYV